MQQLADRLRAGRVSGGNQHAVRDGLCWWWRPPLALPIPLCARPIAERSRSEPRVILCSPSLARLAVPSRGLCRAAGQPHAPTFPAAHIHVHVCRAPIPRVAIAACSHHANTVRSIDDLQICCLFDQVVTCYVGGASRLPFSTADCGTLYTCQCGTSLTALSVPQGVTCTDGLRRCFFWGPTWQTMHYLRMTDPLPTFIHLSACHRSRVVSLVCTAMAVHMLASHAISAWLQHRL